MLIVIRVASLRDDRDIEFQALELFHEGCAETMATSRSPSTDIHTLRCKCGLEIILIGDQAKGVIIHTAIDEQSRTLDSSIATTNLPGTVAIRICGLDYNP